MPYRGSAALPLSRKGIKVVDNVLSFASDGRGAPSAKDRSLFLAATAMAYAVWENYVEQVAIEVVTFCGNYLDPERMPETPKRELAKQDTWSLAIHPGWRELWKELVTVKAIGTEVDFGLNTAGPSQVKKLFEYVGIDAFDGVDPEAVTKLDQLVRDRGTIVHTAQPPSASFRKAHAKGWRDYVNGLCDSFDQELLRKAAVVTGGLHPWQ